MKEIKKTNTFFLILVVLHVAASLIVTYLDMQAVKLGTFSSLMLAQLLILVPSFLFFLISGYDILKWIPFKKLKGGTVALTVLFTFLIMPFVSLINVFSQLFTENVAVDLFGEVSGLSPVITIFIIGFFGPFCEEFTFRGVIYGGLRKSGFLFLAAAVTGAYFGLMHLNLNQFSYVLILGVILSLLIEATGSIWAPVIVHVTVNTWNVLMILVSDKFYSAMGIDVFEEASKAATTDMKLMMMGMLTVISVITSLLAAGVFIGISNNEGRLAHVRAVFKRTEGDVNGLSQDGKVRVVTASGYLAIGICIFVIFFLERLLIYLSE